MVTQFAPIPEQLDISSVTLTRTASTTSIVGGTYNFRIIGANIAGINLRSDLITLNVNSGDIVQFTVNASIISNTNNLQRVYLLRDSDNFIISAVDLKTSNLESNVLLPLTINITDLNAGQQVLDLPVVSFSGQVVELLTNNNENLPPGFYIFLNSQWQQIPSPSLSVEDTQDELGSNRFLSLLTETLIPLPDKPEFSDSINVPLLFRNRTAVAIPTNTKLNFEFTVNGESTDATGESYNNLLSGLVETQIQGVFNFTTNVFDNSIAQSSRTWFASATSLTLPIDIPANSGIQFTFRFIFDSSQIANIVASSIGFNVIEQGLVGSPSSLGNLLGDVVFSDPDGKFRIVPGLPIRALSGSAVIGGQQKEYFQTPIRGEQDFTGLIEDTASQTIAISGSRGGSVRVIPSGGTLDGLEAIRAFVGTLPGQQNANAFNPSQTATLTSAGSLEIQIDISEVDGLSPIRSSYPDVISENSGIFNAPQVVIYLRNSLGEIYESLPLAVPPTGSLKTFVLSDIGNLVASVPVNADSSFGLFAGEVFSITASGLSGTIPAETYTATFAWLYPTPNFLITSVSHSTLLGCIPELNVTINDLINGGGAAASGGNPLINTLSLFNIFGG